MLVQTCRTPHNTIAGVVPHFSLGPQYGLRRSASLLVLVGAVTQWSLTFHLCSKDTTWA